MSARRIRQIERENQLAECRRQEAQGAEVRELLTPFPIEPGTPLAEVNAYIPNYGGEHDLNVLIIQLCELGTGTLIRKVMPNNEDARALAALYAKNAQRRVGIVAGMEA